MGCHETSGKGSARPVSASRGAHVTSSAVRSAAAAASRALSGPSTRIVVAAGADPARPTNARHMSLPKASETAFTSAGVESETVDWAKPRRSSGADPANIGFNSR